MGDKEDQRLNSWKEIATYLNRDLRTVARWEKEQRLPVHRIGEGKRRPVFAYTDEIDAWLARATPEQLESKSEPEGEKRNRFSLPLKWLVAASVVLIAAAAFWISGHPNTAIDHVSFVQNRLIAFDQNNQPRWTLPLDSSPHVKLVAPPKLVDINNDGSPEVLACLSGFSRSDGSSSSAEFLNLSEAGSVLWRLQPDNVLHMSGRDFTGPWVAEGCIEVGASRSAVAMAVHHWTWWPSMVVTADATGKVVGEFVNSGWIHALASVKQLSASVLLAGGISNSRDAAILAVLDPENMNGSSPEDPGSEFECSSCNSGRPLRYFVFPRSELNQSTPAPYNRVTSIDVLADRVLVRVLEVQQPVAQTESAIDAIYEFTRDMEFRGSQFNHYYWDLHRRLDQEGKLKHSQAECPDKNGSRSIRSWSAKEGWKEVRPMPE